MIVHKGGLADSDGFLAGDLIQSVDGTPVKTVKQMIERLHNAPAREDIVMRVIRAQQTTTIVVSGGTQPPVTALSE
jgi:S1-C subfamily serine protease